MASLFNKPPKHNIEFHIGQSFCLPFRLEDNADNPLVDITNYTIRMQVRKEISRAVIADFRTPLTKALTDVAVDAAAKTYTSTATDFADFGIEVADTVTWTGFANGGNNAALVVTAVSEKILTFGNATGLVTEAAGASVSLSVPRGIVITDAPNSKFQLQMSKAQSEAMNSGRNLAAKYDIFIESPTGDVTKLVEGKFDIKGKITAIVKGTA